MPAFRLSQDTITRLRTKFLEFRQNREILQNIISEYIIDYTRTTGTMIERQEALREKYSRKKFTHLIWDDSDNNNNIWWTAADIAIILGREKSSVTRTLAVMERSEEWRSRLLALRRTDRAANGLKIYSYKQEIFDLIIDHYEEEYLQRFAAPRHGDKAQDIDEIKKFWEYLKVTAELEHENFIDDSNSNEDNETVSEIPPLTYKNILSLIWQKVFTVKIMTITSVIFALCFEIARHFYITKYFFPVSSLIIFAACLLLIRKGISRLDIISDTGAGSLLFLFLWLGGMS